MAVDYTLYALLAFFIWSLAIIIDKILRAKYLKDSVYIASIFGIFNFILFLFIVPFIKITFPGMLYFSLAFFAGVLTLAGFIPYYKALSFADASRVTPLWQICPLFTLFLAFLFLSERLTLNDYIGFFLVLAGGILISIVKIEGGFRISKAFWLMIFSCVLFAVWDVILKFVYSNADYWSSTFYVFLGFFISSLLVILVKKHKVKFREMNSKIKKIVLTFIIIGSLAGLVGKILYFIAVTMGPISIVSVLEGFEALFVLIFALILSIWFPKLLKEKIDRNILIIKIIAIFLMFVGLMFLYL